MDITEESTEEPIARLLAVNSRLQKMVTDQAEQCKKMKLELEFLKRTSTTTTESVAVEESTTTTESVAVEASTTTTESVAVEESTTTTESVAVEESTTTTESVAVEEHTAVIPEQAIKKKRPRDADQMVLLEKMFTEPMDTQNIEESTMMEKLLKTNHNQRNRIRLELRRHGTGIDRSVIITDILNESSGNVSKHPVWQDPVWPREIPWPIPRDFFGDTSGFD